VNTKVAQTQQHRHWRFTTAFSQNTCLHLSQFAYTKKSSKPSKSNFRHYL